MSIELTLVVDNSVHEVDEQAGCKRGLLGELGFSLYLDCFGKNRTRLLYDCGRKGAVLMNNLDVLGLSPSAIDHVVVSHGHAGHVGGLASLAPRLANHATVVVDRAMECVVDNAETSVSESTFRPRVWRHLKDRALVRYVEAPVFLCENVIVAPCAGTDELLTDGPQNRSASETRRELAMAVVTRQGFVIVSSCGHVDLLTLIWRFHTLLNERQFIGAVGAFSRRDDKSAEQTVATLDGYRPTLIAPCHTIDRVRMGGLASAFPTAYRDFSTGDFLSLD